ncbi:hypothetical protein LTR37_006629 [Vermiconidia calcicola]|uniref:Uncharacterized protein n=1 Tax=Vermiconidia calcicola TaxID=1690605 RepID=A0ACC3NH52_9PEZI|nr:hypothetical protein LTR37_006629 [Vermiconidia calcicola]
MATTAAMTPQPVPDGIEHKESTTTASTVSSWTTPQFAPHPRAAEILRQVEFYFGDDSLRQDAHLLGLIKEGNGSVSLNEVLSWRKMKQFKPMSAVREVLKQSTVVEITGNNKRIKRKLPLQKSMTVIPKINDNRKRNTVPTDKPWLTKAMLKPTGFEEYATDGPVRPAEFEQDREEYDPDIAFTQRIETAVARFTSKRKMHQNTKLIFDKFMLYGGIDSGPQQFTGGLSKADTEELTAKEIAERTSCYGVSERVVDGLDYDNEDGKAKWIVDFEAIAKGFLSSQFMSMSIWSDEDQVRTATNVLRNFYNYLLLHEVCPEYKDQLLAARKVCDLAEVELIKLADVDVRLPGGFNTACSTLFGGNYAGLHASEGDWVHKDDDLGWSDEDAKIVFLTGIAAYGTEEQLARVETLVAKGDSFASSFRVVSTEKLGLEVVSIELMKDEAKKIYEDSNLINTVIRPMGKLHCIRWEVPHAPPMDLPKSVIEARKKARKFEFLLEEETLKYCYPGLKMEAEVKELDIGIKWIDYFEATYASFFTWLANERIREWKEPGPPKAWMLRQMGKEDGDGEVVPYDRTEDEVEDDDEMD